MNPKNLTLLYVISWNGLQLILFRIVGTLPAASIPSVMSSQATLVTSSGQIMRPVLTGSQQPRAQAPQIMQQV